MTGQPGISRRKTIGVFSGLALVVLLLAIILSGGNQPAQVATCPDKKIEFEFSGLRFCFGTEEILRQVDINLESPAVLLALQLDGKPLEISFLQLDDEQLTGGLHTHLGLSIPDTFQLLMAPDETPQTVLVRRILDVDATTWLLHDHSGALDIYVLVRPRGQYSAIYLLRQEHEGGVMLAGEFDPDQSRLLLSRLQTAMTE